MVRFAAAVLAVAAITPTPAEKGFARLSVSSETVGGATYQNPLTTTKKHDLRLKTTARKN